MTDSSAISQTINTRYSTMMLDVLRIQDETSQTPDDKATGQDIEQGHSGRSLLRVEKLARRDKELNRKSEQNYINGIRDLVHQSLNTKFEETLEDTEYLYEKVLGFEHKLPH